MLGAVAHELLDRLRREGRVSGQALDGIERWLGDPELESFVPDIEELVRRERWDELEESFYAHLNIGTGATTSFIPDREGTYRVMLVVDTDAVATGEDTKYGPVDYFNLWSDEVSVDITVGPAP